MKLLGIDCGFKNLAYCLYDTDTKMIEIWEVIDISNYLESNKCTYIPEICIQYLDQHKELLNCTKVIIEKQPPRNAKMRVMEAALFSYFYIRGKLEENTISTIENVETYSAKHKLSGILGISGKKSYGARKKLAINKVIDVLKNQTDDTWLKYFCEHKKRDDLADSYLMLLAYVQNQIDAVSQTASSVNKRILAKKPPSNTSPSDYSLGQLKFILQRRYFKTKNFYR
jgi:flavodoxin